MEQQKIFGMTYFQALGAIAAIIGIVSAFLAWITVSGTSTVELLTYPYTQTVTVSLSYSGTYGFPSTTTYNWNYFQFRWHFHSVTVVHILGYHFL